MERFYYSGEINQFISAPDTEIIGHLTTKSEFSVELTQREAWSSQINILKNSLVSYDGQIFFEYSIPRMGRRIDVVLIIGNAIFVLEFKVGEKEYTSSAIDQVWDYALDLKNFHKESYASTLAPILVATQAKDSFNAIATTKHNPSLLFPLKTNGNSLSSIISDVMNFSIGQSIDGPQWGRGVYSPTPTIIEAAKALYNGHSVKDLVKKSAGGDDFEVTSQTISNIIQKAKIESQKSIIFLTGVPGAGKTLVGLDISTKHFNKDEGLTSVFLSGNGPLVAVLREALTIDKYSREKEAGKKPKKGEIMSQVKAFIQNVHHYRDECLIDKEKAPFDHIAIFDEAQRAWNLTQTSNFMARRKGEKNFNISEPEFLISCLNRHDTWAVIICLVGGGQEINTGEAGIAEWIASLNRSYKNWHVYISDKLSDSEYAAGEALQLLEEHKNVVTYSTLHLSVSVRSFRAENLARFVKALLDIDIEAARKYHEELNDRYPILITRDLNKAKSWLREIASGTERYGMLVSSQAIRLKPYAIDVKSPMDPVHWFLKEKDDIRSSYYLEDVATEFQVQGLELDWTCISWDADFRFQNGEWSHHSFVGTRWNKINQQERKQYLKNAYRVLLTRARQGFVIFVPPGDNQDLTRRTSFYDSTYQYLKSVGIRELI